MLQVYRILYQNQASASRRVQIQTWHSLTRPELNALEGLTFFLFLVIVEEAFRSITFGGRAYAEYVAD